MLADSFSIFHVKMHTAVCGFCGFWVMFLKLRLLNCCYSEMISIFNIYNDFRYHHQPNSI